MTVEGVVECIWKISVLHWATDSPPSKQEVYSKKCHIWEVMKE